MNKVSYFHLILLAFAFFSAAGHAEDRPVRELKAFLDTTKTLTADFKQVLINEAGDPVQTSYGIFYLQRPGKFRWDYQRPFQQQIIANSGKVWFYDTDLEQVTIKKLDESLGSTPALLLSGEVSLEDNFIQTQRGSVDRQAGRRHPRGPGHRHPAACGKSARLGHYRRRPGG
jgi:outer membrane lipoprotein carrier protein